MSLTDDQQVKVLYFRDWTKSDRNIQQMVAQVMATHAVTSLAALAEEHPETFDELYEVVEGILAEIPTRNDPFFTR